jgi:ribosomal protein S18 acetylase RimI-like enzyme
VIIRTYRPTDEMALVALWRVTGLVRSVNDPHRDIARKVERDANGLLVADINGEVVGSVMVGYDGHRGWINYLAVVPAGQMGGVGRALVAAAEARVAAFGGPKVNLQVRSGNAAAVGFYERLGYRVDDVVSMGRRLGDDDSNVA